MTDPGKMMLNAALLVKNAHTKALAAFLFRDVIEDAHAKIYRKRICGICAKKR